MKAIVSMLSSKHIVLLPLSLIVLSSSILAAQTARTMPWQAAGLTERQAAAHLLRRATLGIGPGDINAVLESGLERWLDGQLLGDAWPEPSRGRWALDPSELVEQVTTRSQVSRAALRDGIVTAADWSGDNGLQARLDAEATVMAYAKEQGLERPQDVRRTLVDQKIERGLRSESQLFEVVVDFWLNHFNVSARDPAVAVHLLSFERDAIRPHAFGSFRELLGATARHPAMLQYLDNASSRADADVVTTFDLAVERLNLEPSVDPVLRRLAKLLSWRELQSRRFYKAADAAGLNENYARELLELHTLGVDGGYDQKDVIEVARVLTGRTVLRSDGRGRGRWRGFLADEELAVDLGFWWEYEFLFRPDWHDARPKQVLGVEIDNPNGMEEGELLLDLLASHRSTARHIALKLAQRFISDHPSPNAVSHLANVFELERGNIGLVLWELFRLPEFWSEAHDPRKVRSPWELALASLRALDGRVSDAKDLLGRLEDMGLDLYNCDVPTGFPDEAGEWLSADRLLHRIRFVRAFTTQSLEGVRTNESKLGVAAHGKTLEEVVAEVAAKILGAPRTDVLERLAAVARPESEEDAVGPATTPAAAQRTLRQALFLTLTSPEFQRR